MGSYDPTDDPAVHQRFNEIPYLITHGSLDGWHYYNSDTRIFSEWNRNIYQQTMRVDRNRPYSAIWVRQTYVIKELKPPSTAVATRWYGQQSTRFACQQTMNVVDQLSAAAGSGGPQRWFDCTDAQLMD